MNTLFIGLGIQYHPYPLRKINKTVQNDFHLRKYFQIISLEPLTWIGHYHTCICLCSFNETKIPLSRLVKANFHILE